MTWTPIPNPRRPSHSLAPGVLVLHGSEKCDVPQRSGDCGGLCASPHRLHDTFALLGSRGAGRVVLKLLFAHGVALLPKSVGLTVSTRRPACLGTPTHTKLDQCQYICGGKTRRKRALPGGGNNQKTNMHREGWTTERVVHYSKNATQQIHRRKKTIWSLNAQSYKKGGDSELGDGEPILSQMRANLQKTGRRRAGHGEPLTPGPAPRVCNPCAPCNRTADSQRRSRRRR